MDKWLELNREYSQRWPNITVKKEMPKDARDHWDEAGKFQKSFAQSGSGQLSSRNFETLAMTACGPTQTLRLAAAFVC